MKSELKVKKIGIVTGARAEYGLLKPLIEKVHASGEMELQLAVTGMHLSPEFGLTCREIEADGYPVAGRIEMLLSSDTPVGVTKSMGVALLGFADYFAAHRPDIVILLGDRYEMFMAACAAMAAGIPIAHIHGGELTEGAMDDAIRHAITKMSHLHFTATKEYRNRVIQMGEQPGTVYHVGSLGVEKLREMRLGRNGQAQARPEGVCGAAEADLKSGSLMSREELEQSLNFKLDAPVAMVTYHPVTLDDAELAASGRQFEHLLRVLERHKELRVIFTKANADPYGRVINQMTDQFAAEHSDRCVTFSSLGQLRYFSALQFCSVVLGNSSSGIIEAPSFGIPTVNIGERQKGRVSAASVLHCANAEEDIERALRKALSPEFRAFAAAQPNPYEGDCPSGEILRVICGALEKGINLKKKFYDI